MADGGDAPIRVRNTGRMLRAVNAEIRAMPAAVRAAPMFGALAELAREVARDFDAGERAAAGRLGAALGKLRTLATQETARAAAKPPPPAEAPVDERDELDDLAERRAARLADASGVVRALGADQRRTGGHPAG